MRNFTSMHNDYLDPDRYINPEYCECCGERDMACTCMECVKCGAIGDPDCSERCGTPNEQTEPSDLIEGRIQYVDGKPLTDPLDTPAFSFVAEEYGVYVDYCIINGTIHTHGAVDSETYCEDLFYDVDKLRDLNADKIRTLVENACWYAVEIFAEQGIDMNTIGNPKDEIEKLSRDVVEEFKHHMSHYTQEA